MTREPDPSIVDRWLAGEATPDDESALGEWTAADPARAAWLEALRARATSRERAWHVDAAWARVANRTTLATDAPRTLRVERGGARPAPRRLAWVGRAAAAAVLVVGSAAVWRVAGSRDAVAPTVASAPTRELVAPRGSRADVRLADGTHVVLNAGSRLRYADDYGAPGAKREAWLDGEGYFEVKHDAARPFRVHALGGVAEDLGTRFVVRAYPELARVDVMVAEGRVGLRRDTTARGDSAVLGAGQLGRLSHDGTLTVSRAPADERYLAWTTGVLVLDGEPLRDALPRLERRYDLTIRLADGALGARPVVARFRDQPAGEMLDALALALGARYERQGRVVTFHAAEVR
ncbi:FecR protein [Gemmatirosa kalamazoonensis]|uniref:FecR protein n=1 Tax=Gemmatirosa kalamazoonensis TaxID=861299 RepID=W0RHL7_9BACT|nr:FecR domain-containing protein [Gemmatirosa kalamazoonensis]AHG89922.1 FecR protein [Gemmatirosa kalamazoonensis]